DGLGEGLLLPLRQETDVSHVDAQHWHVRGVRDVGGSQEGAIAAKYEHHLHTLSCLTGVAETWEAPQDLVTRHGSWIGGCHHADVNAAFMELGRRFGGHTQVLVYPGMGDEQHLALLPLTRRLVLGLLRGGLVGSRHCGPSFTAVDTMASSVSIVGACFPPSLESQRKYSTFP